MWFVIAMVAVAILAFWVSYEVHREGGYNPYRDNSTETKASEQWPFPTKDRP